MRSCQLRLSNTILTMPSQSPFVCYHYLIVSVYLERNASARVLVHAKNLRAAVNQVALANAILPIALARLHPHNAKSVTFCLLSLSHC
jgi:hypothetical protein